MTNQRVIVIGGGLAGISATMKLAELGMSVLIVSILQNGGIDSTRISEHFATFSKLSDAFIDLSLKATSMLLVSVS